MTRRPTVEWQVAGACNYQCSYCIQSPRLRRGRPEADQLQRAVATFAALPGAWEIKCSGGEAFAHPLFLDLVVPGLMRHTRHTISVLTNFSTSEADLARFLDNTRGRLSVVSASLHVEHVDPTAFVAKAAWFVREAGPGVAFVVNQVVLPGKEHDAACTRALVEGAGLRWFPQLYKVKAPAGARGESGDPFTIAEYPDADALTAIIGDAPGPREANVAPSYRGRRCWAGVDYFVVDKDGEAWSCRTAKRHKETSLGNVFDGTLRRWVDPRPCPWSLCPCTVPANRGMIEGVAS